MEVHASKNKEWNPMHIYTRSVHQEIYLVRFPVQHLEQQEEESDSMP